MTHQYLNNCVHVLFIGFIEIMNGCTCMGYKANRIKVLKQKSTDKLFFVDRVLVFLFNNSRWSAGEHDPATLVFLASEPLCTIKFYSAWNFLCVDWCSTMWSTVYSVEVFLASSSLARPGVKSELLVLGIVAVSWLGASVGRRMDILLRTSF